MNKIKPVLSRESPLETIYGHNPLLIPIGQRIPYEELSLKLSNSALENYDLSNLDKTAREELLILYRQNYVPTTFAIKIAASLQNLHRENYWQRHPCNPTYLKNRMWIAQYFREKNFDPEKIPWLPNSASGMIIKGITGTGKSAIINRYTNVIGTPVYEHLNGQIPGFSYIKQITWLKVDMSSDGSRSGLLTAILLEIDRLIDTQYADQFTNRYPVDKLAVRVAYILSIHFCGLLIIEEIQEKNFNNSMWHHDLVTFFLRVLNFGTPTVLIGNFLGFVELEKASQNVRRLSEGGIFEAFPYTRGDDPSFESLVEETLSFNVMETQDQETSDYFRKVAFPYSGGIIDFLVRLNVGAQRIALQSNQEKVLPTHINSFFKGEHMKGNHDLIIGLVTKDVNRLRKISDIPTSRLEEIWRGESRKDDVAQLTDKSASQKNIPSQSTNIDTKNESAVIGFSKRSNDIPSKAEKTRKNLGMQLKREQTLRTKKREKAEKQQKLLAEDDIRRDGAAGSMAPQLEDLLGRNREK